MESTLFNQLQFEALNNQVNYLMKVAEQNNENYKRVGGKAKKFVWTTEAPEGKNKLDYYIEKCEELDNLIEVSTTYKYPKETISTRDISILFVNPSLINLLHFSDKFVPNTEAEISCVYELGTFNGVLVLADIFITETDDKLLLYNIANGDVTLIEGKDYTFKKGKK